MRITIKRWGNSSGMVIPNVVMKELNLRPGQSVEAQVSNNQLILTPISRRYSLDELLAQSDLISLHCPLMDETYHMINRESIQKMKDGVILVNTSRGGLVKTADLIEGIRARKFFAVGLDVYEEEKKNVFEDRSDEIMETSITARLLSFPNVIITSHQGFFTYEALDAISETTLNNAMAFTKGERTGNEVEIE